jgi:phosphopantothenoylcysteine decarboxylase / phosphopantothenate---cysteine ligase
VKYKQGKKRQHIVVTAGPTREKIDPVRFISNYSTGAFGYAIAEEARKRGHKVTLISGPVEREIPRGVKTVKVESALDMYRAVHKESRKAGCVIMAAAVSDWRPLSAAPGKLKKGVSSRVLRLVENPDIIGSLGKRKKRSILVAFALETEDLRRNALKKLKEKNVDMIVANKLSRGKPAFGDKTLSILMIERSGKTIAVSNKTKKELAKIILDKALSFNI